MPSPNTRSCSACGTVMPASFPEGLCPKCLLKAAAPPESDRTIPVAPPVSGSVPARPMGVPALETLRALLPDLEILDVLGAGGMGAVYKARQPRLNRLVALKIMVCPPGHEAAFALRFEREAQVLARLNHPHIVILHDFGELGPERTGADPLFYFLMEYVDGTDLNQLIKSKELKPAQALAIVPQICEALQYAHDQGITHRDIKPANILMDKRGVVKIADFGLAKMITGTEEALMTGLTQTGTAMGTPHYMAPEQWEHPDQVDHRADIYALGVVFYEMLTGERPAGVFEPPSKKTQPPVDKKLDGVVMRAMDKNPERRYQQAGQIRDDVTRITGANKSRPATIGAPEAKRSPLKALLALGAVAALGFAGWMLSQSGAVGPSSAADSSKTLPSAAMEFPPGQWIRVLDTPGRLSGGLAALEPGIWAEGWLAASEGRPLPGVNIPRFEGKNMGVRVRVRRQADNASAVFCHVWVRKGVAEKGSREIYRLTLQTSGALLNFWDEKNKAPQNLQPPLTLPLEPGEEAVLELFAIGQRLIARCNDRLLPVAEDSRLAVGAAGLQILHEARDIEVINLDGLSEAEALKLAGVSEPQPAAFPQGRWTRVLATQAEVDAQSGLKGRVTLKPDGWLDFSVPKEAAGAALTAFSAANAGVRVKLRIADKALRPVVATLTLRHTTTPPPRQEGYRLQIAGGDTANPSLSLALYDGQTRKLNILNKHIRLGALKAGDEMSLEFYTIGSRLIGRVNGELLPIAEDTRLTRGIFTLQTGHLLRDIELINLDGLSEAEALKLAGVGVAEDTAVTGTAKPGHLRAAGILRNGGAPDIAKFAAVDDFVDVAAGADHWVALRANGETVSSDGKADFQGIRKIARSYHSHACFIDKAGGLRFHPAQEMALPVSLKGAKVADAACGSHHGVALLEDGRAVAFGRRYEEAMEDASQPQGLGTPRWPQPEAAALQNVKGVAVTYTHAATLHHDGTVSIWGWEGPVKWKTEPEMQPVRQISSFHDALHLLDEAGQVWSFPLPRSAHPQQPVGFNGRVKLLGKDAVRLRDHLWLNADGAWRAVEADLPTVDTLESATLRPETNFALFASASGAKPFGYVLWVEPGE